VDAFEEEAFADAFVEAFEEAFGDAFEEALEAPFDEAFVDALVGALADAFVVPFAGRLRARVVRGRAVGSGVPASVASLGADSVPPAAGRA
jgi:hypothetical protein